MLDGLISEEDFINQKNWYDEKIKNLKDKFEYKKNGETLQKFSEISNNINEVIKIDIKE